MDQLIHTVNEARALLAGMSRAVLYEEINSGRLRSFKRGRRRYIPADALRDYVKERESEGRGAGNFGSGR